MLVTLQKFWMSGVMEFKCTKVALMYILLVMGFSKTWIEILNCDELKEFKIFKKFFSQVFAKLPLLVIRYWLWYIVPTIWLVCIWYCDMMLHLCCSWKPSVQSHCAPHDGCIQTGCAGELHCRLHGIPFKCLKCVVTGEWINVTFYATVGWWPWVMILDSLLEDLGLVTGQICVWGFLLTNCDIHFCQRQNNFGLWSVSARPPPQL